MYYCLWLAKLDVLGEAIGDFLGVYFGCFVGGTLSGMIVDVLPAFEVDYVVEGY